MRIKSAFRDPRARFPSLRVLSPVFLVAAFGCQNLPETTGLRKPEAEVRDIAANICLSPTQIEIDTTEPAERSAEFEHYIRQRLEIAGFEVTSSTEVLEVAKAFGESHPGCYDPHTGRPGEAACAARTAAQDRLLRERFGCGAILNSRVVEVSASFDRGMVTWDGRSERTGSGYSGFVPATSLRVVILGPGMDNVLYWRSAGIEASSVLKVNLMDAQFDPLPRDQRLRSAPRNMRAVLSALGPFAGDPAPASSKCVQRLADLDRRPPRSDPEWEIRRDREIWLAACELRNRPPGPVPAPPPTATEEATPDVESRTEGRAAASPEDDA